MLKSSCRSLSPALAHAAGKVYQFALRLRNQLLHGGTLRFQSSKRSFQPCHLFGNADLESVGSCAWTRVQTMWVSFSATGQKLPIRKPKLSKFFPKRERSSVLSAV